MPARFYNILLYIRDLGYFYGYERRIFLKQYFFTFKTYFLKLVTFFFAY